MLSKKQRKVAAEQVIAEKEQLIAETDRLKTQIYELEKRNAELENEVEEKEEFISKLTIGLSLWNESLPIVSNLADIIINKAEDSILQVTDKIFNIGNQSKSLGKQIRDSLFEMTNGDKSIEHGIQQIRKEIVDLSDIVKAFEELQITHAQDQTVIERSVHGINNFTSTITDLAEQTSILAINASIEAARVGNAGKGFAVIAGNVQELAKKSGALATQITSTILETGKAVSHSFELQNEKIGKAVEMIKECSLTLNSTIGDLTPQVAGLKDSVENTHSSSAQVTEDLNQITMGLQFQDIIRQIMSHIVEISKEVNSNCTSDLDPQILDQPSWKNHNRQKLQEYARKYFAMEEEWQVLKNWDIYKDEPVTATDSRFNGDIELF